jgi:hypothetical protein
MPGTIERLSTRLALNQYEVTFVMAASFLAQRCQAGQGCLDGIGSLLWLRKRGVCSCDASDVHE